MEWNEVVENVPLYALMYRDPATQETKIGVPRFTNISWSGNTTFYNFKVYEKC